jgi:hypothetical protein
MRWRGTRMREIRDEEGVGRAWMVWEERARAAKRMGRAECLLLLRGRYRCADQAFDSWVEEARREARGNQTCMRAGERRCKKTLAWSWDILQEYACEQKALSLEATAMERRHDAVERRGMTRSKAGAFLWWVQLLRTEAGVGKLRDRMGLRLKSRRWGCWRRYMEAAWYEELEEAHEASRLAFRGALEHAQRSSRVVFETTIGRYFEALDRRRGMQAKRVVLTIWQEVAYEQEAHAALKHASAVRLLRLVDNLARRRETRSNQEAFRAVRHASWRQGGRRAMAGRLIRLAQIRKTAEVWRAWHAQSILRRTLNAKMSAGMYTCNCMFACI